MTNVDLQNSIYEISNKAHGIRDLLVLVNLGCADKMSDVGDALDPVVDSLCDLCDRIDQLQAEINKPEETAERDPQELPFT